MGARDSLDLAEVLRIVVRPTLGALLQPGELDSVTLEWRQVRIPGWSVDVGGAVGLSVRSLTREEFESLPWREVLRLVVEVKVKDETFSFEIASAEDEDAVDEDEVDLDWAADEFYGRLQDFIAESRFGWGQLRTGALNDPGRE